jgi:hypothetical protein
MTLASLDAFMPSWLRFGAPRTVASGAPFGGPRFVMIRAMAGPAFPVLAGWLANPCFHE